MAKRNGSLYGAYVFRAHEKDPSIDELRTKMEDHFGHRIKGKDLAFIHNDGGPSVSCMHQWFFGKTRRPTNAALEAAGRAMGYQRVWQRMRKNSR